MQPRKFRIEKSINFRNIPSECSTIGNTIDEQTKVKTELTRNGNVHRKSWMNGLLKAKLPSHAQHDSSSVLCTEVFNMRVRSWLRMNAGGVPNTCKSNGIREINLRKRLLMTVADG